MATLGDSDSSDLSEHSDKEIQKLAPVFLKAKRANKIVAPPPKASPPKPKRPPSPPHEEVLADNPDIALIVMFRSRFNDAMPPKLAHFGPQDVERGVVEPLPSKEMQALLCALLGLTLNRKKPVERGHHGRALEEAVLSMRKEWPQGWKGVNPLHGGKNFENMTPVERLNLLRTLIMWSLSNSEAISTILKDKYKQQRHSDDENQPLSVQPWGVDGDKRRYFLVQGQADTAFRVYREGGRYTPKTTHWYSVAGSIDEVKELAKKLDEVDGSQAARRLAMRITNAIPTFEATEEKRRRREYRQERRAQFSRPEPGFSLYEGRTRGKRMRYTYDDDEDLFNSDDTSTRRSVRQSGRSTPFESMPTITASGRQIRQPRTGEYGESLLSGPPMNMETDGEGATSRARSGTEDSEQPVRGGGRATRSGGNQITNGASNPRKRKHIDTYNSIDEMSDEESEGSVGGWDSDKNEAEDEPMPDAESDDDKASDADEESEGEEPQSLILKLKVPSAALSKLAMGTPAPRDSTPPADENTRSGAMECEQAHQPTINGQAAPYTSIEHAPQPNSSPIGPSAYPTPTSSSFLPPEQKLAPVLGQSMLPASQITSGPTLSNGQVTNGIAKTEEHIGEVEMKPQGLPQVKSESAQSAQTSWPLFRQGV